MPNFSHLDTNVKVFYLTLGIELVMVNCAPRKARSAPQRRTRRHNFNCSRSAATQPPRDVRKPLQPLTN